MEVDALLERLRAADSNQAQKARLFETARQFDASRADQQAAIDDANRKRIAALALAANSPNNRSGIIGRHTAEPASRPVRAAIGRSYSPRVYAPRVRNTGSVIDKQALALEREALRQKAKEDAEFEKQQQALNNAKAGLFAEQNQFDPEFIRNETVQKPELTYDTQAIVNEKDKIPVIGEYKDPNVTQDELEANRELQQLDEARQKKQITQENYDQARINLIRTINPEYAKNIEEDLNSTAPERLFSSDISLENRVKNAAINELPGIGIVNRAIPAAESIRNYFTKTKGEKLKDLEQTKEARQNQPVEVKQYEDMGNFFNELNNKVSKYKAGKKKWTKEQVAKQAEYIRSKYKKKYDTEVVKKNLEPKEYMKLRNDYENKMFTEIDSKPNLSELDKVYWKQMVIKKLNDEDKAYKSWRTNIGKDNQWYKRLLIEQQMKDKSKAQDTILKYKLKNGNTGGAGSGQLNKNKININDLTSAQYMSLWKLAKKLGKTVPQTVELMNSGKTNTGWHIF